MSKRSNSKKVRKEVRKHINNQKRLSNEAVEAFKNSSVLQRLKVFYRSIPSLQGKIVFWIWSPFILLVFLPFYAFISLSKLDVVWKWTIHIYHTIKVRR